MMMWIWMDGRILIAVKSYIYIYIYDLSLSLSLFLFPSSVTLFGYIINKWSLLGGDGCGDLNLFDFFFKWIEKKKDCEQTDDEPCEFFLFIMLYIHVPKLFTSCEFSTKSSCGFETSIFFSSSSSTEFSMKYSKTKYWCIHVYIMFVICSCCLLFCCFVCVLFLCLVRNFFFHCFFFFFHFCFCVCVCVVFLGSVLCEGGQIPNYYCGDGYNGCSKDKCCAPNEYGLSDCDYEMIACSRDALWVFIF